MNSQFDELLGRIRDLEAENDFLASENACLQEELWKIKNKDAVSAPAVITPAVSVLTVSAPAVSLPAIQMPAVSLSPEPIPTVFEENVPIQKTEPPATPGAPLLHMKSPPEEKIALFMSLFTGRTDVYAKRCFSKKHNAAYYIPACKNEFRSGLCERPRIKCGACKNRQLLPFNGKVVDSHLRNRDENGVGIVGVYALLPDDTCRFLAVDFDEQNWQADVAAFRTACEEKNITVAVERSRSGNGAHAWFFFSEPVPAVTARKFGSMLLTRAMNLRHEIKFSSYDRMFPNQDVMPKGGFGNLIALPLQAIPRKAGNSVFVDSNFVPYSDQWAFLSSIPKITKRTLEEKIALLNTDGELGLLVPAQNENSQDTPLSAQESLPLVATSNSTKPWEQKIPEPLQKSEFSERPTIIFDAQLYISKKGFSQRALNRIQRLAAFSNPLFYRRQRMRMSTHEVPRIIHAATETADYIGIPRGCKDALDKLLADAGIYFEIIDKQNLGEDVKVAFVGELYFAQELAANALLQHDTGVLCATTAFGKTVIGAALIAERQCNTLILVHSQTLLEQWKGALQKFLNFNPDNKPIPKDKEFIGQLGVGKNTLTGIVDVALMQSLLNKNETAGAKGIDVAVADATPNPILQNYGMLIVDECHHVPAFTFEKVVGASNARYVYGLSATPERADGKHPLIFMQCGPIRYRVSAKEQAMRRAFRHFVYPRFTNFHKPFALEERSWTTARIYNEMIENEERNSWIIDDIYNVLREERNPLVLTQRKEHVARLAELLTVRLKANADTAVKAETKVFTLTGAMSASEKNATFAAIASLTPADPFVIVATGQFAGEGFDCPTLDTLFLTMPVAWKGLVTQYAGRLHREVEGKKDVVVYDYVDVRDPVLERMWQKRLNAYFQIGYKVSTGQLDGNRGIIGNVIYDTSSFAPVMKDDFLNAKNEIMIVSPFARKRRVADVIEWLCEPLTRGVKVKVYTRALSSYKRDDIALVRECIEQLSTAGCEIIERENIHQKFVLLDKKIVWYGSVNLLSYGSAEESVMRLEDPEIANELEVTMMPKTINL